MYIKEQQQAVEIEELCMGEIFKIIGDLGFPVAAALAGGYFVFLTIKLLLGGVLSSVKGMAGIITALDNRVKTMNHEVLRVDTLVSSALGLKPDLERIARADGKTDSSKLHWHQWLGILTFVSITHLFNN